jgi:SAM-dependent methyltransferase
LLSGIVLCVAAAVFTQTPSAAEQYTPKEGQPGKDVVWVPTRDAVVEKMLDMAKVTRGDYVIDLGSGDGRMVIAAAKRGARALGIEYNPDMVELSKRNAIAEGVADRTQFVKADIFQSDFSHASVISMFLLPELNLKLRPQLLKLKPGTRIVSNTFPMGDWTPDESFDVAGDCGAYCTALLWIVPAQVEGSWKLPGGQLVLAQTFQQLSGTLGADGKTMTIDRAVLRGDRITFTAGGVEYTGQVLGETIQGEFKSTGTTGGWSAIRTPSR